ncbi:MAG TPA: RNA polymerase sigma factor [Phycisphaerae bacterium]|nr:RNA polymerase sigma factor [Phycisphaerae bacterium]
MSQWAPTLYRLALRLCGKRELAEDLLQETFVEAWKSCDKLSDVAKAKAWLFQILRNRWSHYLRDSSRRLRPSHDQDALERVGSRFPNHSDLLAESDFVQRALDQLDEDLKLPFLCVVMEGYSCQETADLLKIPLGTVLSRLYRARQALRLVLTPTPAGHSPPAGDSRPGDTLASTLRHAPDSTHHDTESPAA